MRSYTWIGRQPAIACFADQPFGERVSLLPVAKVQGGHGEKSGHQGSAAGCSDVDPVHRASEKAQTGIRVALHTGNSGGQ